MQMDANQSDVTIDVIVCNEAVKWIIFLHSKGAELYPERYRFYKDALVELTRNKEEELGHTFGKLIDRNEDMKYFETTYELQEQARERTRKNYGI